MALLFKVLCASECQAFATHFLAYAREDQRSIGHVVFELSISWGGRYMGRRPLPAVRDFTRDGRWSNHDVSVLKKMWKNMHRDRYPLKLPSPTNLARLGHLPPASLAGRLAGLMFCVYVFSLGSYTECIFL